jgi:tetratricopeptide (TPR) repeat protein
MDANQVLDLRLKLPQAGNVEPFAKTIANPLTHVVNPNAKRIEIDRLEEELRTGHIPREDIPGKLVALADAYADLGQREKAVEYLGRVLRSRNAPDAVILNKMAVYSGEMGDVEREEKCYREAAVVWPGAWFNLALAQKKRGLYAEAATSLDKVLLVEHQAAYLVLRAQIHGALGERQQQERVLQEAVQKFGAVDALEDWKLGWFLTAARMASDQEKLSQGEDELRRRHRNEGAVETEKGILPALTAGLKRMDH